MRVTEIGVFLTCNPKLSARVWEREPMVEVHDMYRSKEDTSKTFTRYHWKGKSEF